MGINPVSPPRGYSIAGYQPGDRIGSGVVTDPAEIKGPTRDHKLVTIDYNLNGQKDAGEDQVMVKLPPKGFIPAGWDGPSNRSFGDKIEHGFMPTAIGAFLGGIVGAVGAIGAGAAADAGLLGAKMAAGPNPARIAVGAAIAICALGAWIGNRMGMGTVENDRVAARRSAVPDIAPPKYILNQYLLEQNPQATLPKK